MRAMVPLSDPPKPNLVKPELGGKPILLLSGQADPIVPAGNSAKLAALLSDAGARVDHKVLPAGHQLSQADVTLARGWIGNASAKAA
jgi:phospholipase/carboxylesterase